MPAIPPEVVPAAVEAGGGISQIAFWIGGFIAAVSAGYFGYVKKPKEQSASTTASVVGALVDNSAVQVIADALAEMTIELRANVAELRSLRAVVAGEAMTRAGEAQKREMRAEVDAERRMQELLHRLEEKVESKGRL